ncbi:TadE family protein [Actinoplanes friuliensis]|uniref:TadE-like domain-containing protein n=1 Tax=Actinoplanes friuliensis DSM 7358 TaxID=1246995 RepID=U5VPC9_9ACTN|nr:TadE family protein [Actinoplanes friuliensis]AGZ38662.1 hypothetical protein AFR_01865 [Actinoplanes friuliensis DSM 7358]
MTGRRWPGRLRRLTSDRGAFTAELAAGLPALMLLLFAGLTAVGAVTAKIQCVDAAREGALIAARGGAGDQDALRIAPSGAAVAVSEGQETVTVTVRAPVPILGGFLSAITVRATAVASLEPDGTGTG